MTTSITPILFKLAFVIGLPYFTINILFKIQLFILLADNRNSFLISLTQIQANS